METEAAPAAPCGVIVHQDGTFISLCGAPSLPGVNVLTGVLSKAVFMCERHWEIQAAYDTEQKAEWLSNRSAKEVEQTESIKRLITAWGIGATAFTALIFLPSTPTAVTAVVSIVLGLIPVVIARSLNRKRER